MPASVDIRGIAVKLLKAHHLRYIDMRSIPDPLTGTQVVVLKFRRDKEHSPKAFFDDLNENGIQYKKLVKDPNAQQIICELWPKGQKRRVSELREKARDQQRSKENGGTTGISNGNMPYVGIPSGGTQAIMIQSVAKDLAEAGYEDEAAALLRIAGEQDWEEFHRRLRKVFVRMRLYTRPEVRQLREQISAEIIKEMGPDVELLKGARGSDLEQHINDCIREHIDLVLDTRGIADSVLRRTADRRGPEQKIAQLQRIRRGFSSLHLRAKETGDTDVALVAKSYVDSLANDIQTLADGGSSTRVSLTDPAVSLVSSRQLDAAYLHLVESAYNAR
jgi:hypothetical protein